DVERERSAWEQNQIERKERQQQTHDVSCGAGLILRQPLTCLHAGDTRTAWTLQEKWLWLPAPLWESGGRLPRSSPTREGRLSCFRATPTAPRRRAIVSGIPTAHWRWRAT